jgi:hypothetical protein
MGSTATGRSASARSAIDDKTIWRKSRLLITDDEGVSPRASRGASLVSSEIAGPG